MQKLSDLAAISMGLTLRGSVDDLPTGPVRLLQLRDVDIGGKIAETGLASVEADPSYERFTARPGDLVFRGRGAGIAAALVSAADGELIIASPLILIRPDPTLVEPAYLAWALTAPPAQRHYAQFMQGTSITGVGVRDLSELSIDLPDLATQRKIAALVALQRQEAELLQRLASARSRLIDGLIHQLVTDSHQKG